jgi:hypothetical protein
MPKFIAPMQASLSQLTGALIVGKVMLVADKMQLLRRFDYAPLALLHSV